MVWPLRFADVLRASGATALGPAPPEGLCEGLTVGERPAGPGEALFAIRHGGHDGHGEALSSLAAGAGLCVLGRDWAEQNRAALEGVSGEQRSRLAVCDEPLEALRRLAAFFRARLSCPVVAVGGSNGKTTTKDLLSAMLSASLWGRRERVLATAGTNNGWVGLPLTLTDRSLREGQLPRAVVLEVGIDEPGAMDAHVAMIRPTMVVLTALGPEHLRGLGSPERAADEEMRLFEAEGAWRVLLLEEPRLSALAPRAGDALVGPSPGPTPTGITRVTYRSEAPSPFEVELRYVWEPPDGSYPVEGSLSLPIAGAHAARNAALAASVALSLGQLPAALALGAEAFSPPPMRCEVKVLPGGTTLVDDAFNASPSSVEAALALLSHPAWAAMPKVVLLGDMLDLGDHERACHLALVPTLARLALSGSADPAGPAGSRGGVRLLFFGEAMGEVHRALAEQGVASRHLPSHEDPARLLEHEGDLDGALVLIKGSRGMRLERASWALAGRAFERHPVPRDRVRVGVLGASARPTLARSLARALGRFLEVTPLSPGDPLPDGPGFALFSIDPGLAPGSGSGSAGRLDVAVFAGLPDAPPDEPAEPEARLARLAPWVVSLAEGGSLVIPEGSEAGELLAELLPEGARLVRAEGERAMVRAAAVAAGAPAEAAL